MAIPSESNMRRPILELAANKGESISTRDIIAHLTERFSLTDSQLQERTAGGRKRLNTTLEFARSSLKNAGLVQWTAPGRIKVTSQGIKFLEENNESRLTKSVLNRWRREHAPQNSADENPPTELATADVHPSPDTPDIDEVDTTPDELMAIAYDELQEKLSDDLLESLKSVAPYFFEEIVVRLLEKMGYGEGRAVGRSGDGGIDGIINQDPLGLEKVYVQAKRWQSQVGEPEIRNFSGSLMLKGASKGVFITTSDFSSTARQTAKTISAGSQLIHLVNGQELARLMVEHGVGVVTETTYVVQKLDENFFSNPDEI